MTFVINRWVRDSEFFGRGDLLERLRARGHKPTWVLGNRRVGKTSLLRQIEWLCRTGEWPETVALYWDLQGAGSLAGLKDSFLECLEDAEEITAGLGLDLEDLESRPFLEIISRFRRKIKLEASARFLLLIDECEELVDIAKQEPSILSAFRKLAQSSDRFGLVIAGSQRFMDLDESLSRTSPLLPDFLPPLQLFPLERDEALALLKSKDSAAETADRIYQATFGNPYLVQVLGEHLARLGDWDIAMQELNRAKICHYFFQSNFQCLPLSMRSWWDEGHCIERLTQLDPNGPDFAYCVQSSLARLDSNGKVQINSLLQMVLDGNSPSIESIDRTLAPTREGQPVSAPRRERAPVLKLIETLAQLPNPLSVLPTDHLPDLESQALLDAVQPPGLMFMASLEEPAETVKSRLDGASPEYVLEQPATERTHVYLTGLFLYYQCLGRFPFEDLTDPWERAAAISERDVPIEPEHARAAGLSPKLAMVILRCLKAKAKHRYDNLAKLKADLVAVLDPMA